MSTRKLGDVIETRLTEAELRDTAAAYREHGGNISAMARALGIARQTVHNRLYRAQEAGLVADWQVEAHARHVETYIDARAQKIASFQRKKSKGDWRKPVLLPITGKPFRLKVFGDPHLDADGCDYELFERHWLEMDAGKRIYGVCVGDWFNNWKASLAHLWKHESPPSAAWVCFEHLMAERGHCLLAACSGNHDDWTQAPADPVDLLMKQYGVRYRIGAIRVLVQPEGCQPMYWAIRHKWRGTSMYSAAHWGVRAVREGWDDDTLMIGGHIHQDDTRMVVKPSGHVSHVVQVSAFKMFDEFADVHGFTGQRISPVWDLVIDPRRPATDPDKVKVFWSSDAAQAYLEAIG